MALFFACSIYYYLTVEKLFLPFSLIRFEIISISEIVCHCSVKPSTLVLILEWSLNTGDFICSCPCAAQASRRNI